MLAFIVYPFRVDSKNSYQLLKENLKKLGYSLVKTNRVDFSDAINLNIYNIGKDLEDISKCNLILFANNWEKDEDCKLIWDICMKYKIPIYTEKQLFF